MDYVHSHFFIQLAETGYVDYDFTRRVHCSVTDNHKWVRELKRKFGRYQVDVKTRNKRQE